MTNSAMVSVPDRPDDWRGASIGTIEEKGRQRSTTTHKNSKHRTAQSKAPKITQETSPRKRSIVGNSTHPPAHKVEVTPDNNF